MKNGVRGQQGYFVIWSIVLIGVLVSASWEVSAQRTGAALSGGNVEIPFELYNENLVIVKARIGGLKDVKVLIDTGANPSLISKEVAKHLRIAGTEELLQTLNGTVHATSVVVPEIQLGPLHAESLRVIVQDFDGIERAIGVSLGGVFGLDVLARGFAIDYQHRRLILGSAMPTKFVVRLASQAPFPTVITVLDGQPVRLLLDSGTWEVLVFKNRMHNTAKLRTERTASVASIGGHTRLSWTTAALTLGNAKLGTHTVAVAEVDADPGFDGLLGFAKLGFRRVSFDFDNGLFGWE